MLNASLHQKTIGTMLALLLFGTMSQNSNAGERVVITAKKAVPIAKVETSVRSLPTSIKDVGALLRSGGSFGGGTAGTTIPTGTVVYNNQMGGTSPSIYLPNAMNTNACPSGSVQPMADDLVLQVPSGCGLSGYRLVVAGFGDCAPTFDVHVELWDGNPCETTSSLIAGTAGDFVGVPSDTTLQFLTATFSPAINIPGSVWMRVSFSNNDAGWIIAGNTVDPAITGILPEIPDLGNTLDFWAEEEPTGCNLFVFSSGAYAGFWATLWCELASAPTGACCTGTSCSVLNEIDCTTAGGTWQGAFTDCVPNVCQPGACCNGTDFATCGDGTEATCLDGIFHPNLTCADNPCGPHFRVYENDLFTGQFFVSQPPNRLPGDPPTDIIAADDLTLGAGTPCDLGAYEMVVFGQGNPTDGFVFDARLALWSNDDNGTPGDPTDDRPLAEIPGTAKTFADVPADQLGHRLLVVPNTTVVVDGQVWISIETTPDIGGPGLTGFATIGDSLDQFAEFNGPNASNAWATGLFFGGFTPDLCPGPSCVPGGNFRARAWCAGNPPTGACCDRAAGTCTDNVTELECAGRWAEGDTCANPNAFSPACGTHACCFEFLAGNVLCSNLDEASCAAQNGALKKGSFCEDADFVGCPGVGCLNQTGDCLIANGSPGCDDAFCCEQVCALDATCCSGNWSQSCADSAAASCDIPGLDDCANAVAIQGTGLFDFDTTNATQDGPPHAACNTQGGGADIDKDTWFAWTSTCDGTAFVRTCTHTAVDTMIAVYDGTTCPDSDASLIDCDDEKCTPQSMVTFAATSGQSYLIRVGSRVGAAGGTGQIEITCGPPDNSACPGNGDCCAANPSVPGCTDKACCDAVCACDPFCCNTEWDASCSTLGLNDLGCGAALLCQSICGPNCPIGTVLFTVPGNGAIDARMPHEVGDSNATLGVTTILATGPAGIAAECWSLCETGTPAVPNSIVSVTGLGNDYTIELAHPLATGQATTITYSDSALTNTTGTFVSHPGNADGDLTANANDVVAMIDDLSGGFPLPFGELSRDIDHSGRATAIDLLRVIDLLNGADSFATWNATPKPVAAPDCP